MQNIKHSNETLLAIEEQVNTTSISYDYKTKDYPFEVLVSKFGEENDQEATLYVPEYQRQFIWEPKRQSRFIESVLLGVPLTPFLVSEDENKRLEIIDGSQRIRTLIAFSEDRLRLRGIEKLDKINGYKFKDLPRKLQNNIKNRDFKVIVVSDKADENVRRDIFGRINTSSAELTESELRKGAYSGNFYNLILELKDLTLLKKLCPVSKSKEKRGEYEELILRFFTYSEQYLNFKHDVTVFLNSFLDDKNSNEFDHEQYREKFCAVLNFVNVHFPNGFRKEQNSNSTPRVRFEAIAVGVYLALQINPNVTPTYMTWLNSEKFKLHTTSDSSNNKFKLKDRVEFVRDCILNIIEENTLK